MTARPGLTTELGQSSLPGDSLATQRERSSLQRNSLPSFRWLGVLLGVVAALAFAARVYRLGAQSIWLDEGLSILFARPDLGQLLSKLITDDIHPPLYIVTLHYWMLMAGDSEFAVRFLSASFGVLLVPLVYRLAKDLVSPTGRVLAEAELAGLAAAILVALSPFLVYYSQEARNYIAVAFWVTLASWSLWRALLGRGRRWWWLYAVTSALALYTHYYAGFVLLAQALYLSLGWRDWRRVWRPFLLAVAGMCILYLPWLAGLLGQATNLWLHPDYWPGTLDLWAVAARTFSVFALGVPSAVASPALLGFAALFALGLVVLVWKGALRSQRGELFLAVSVLVPLLAVYGVSYGYPKFAERYLIIITPAFYLVLARALASLYSVGGWLAKRWSAASTLATLLSALLILAIGGYSAAGTWQVYYGPEWAKDDYRAAIHTIEASAQPGDVILLTRNMYQSFLYYYHGSLPWFGLDAAGPGAAPNVALVAKRLNEMVKGHTRVWHLLWQEEVTDATQTVGGLLGKYGRQVPLGTEYTGVRLNLYELPPDVVFAGTPEQALRADYENGLRLWGYDLKTGELRPGEVADLAFYWDTTRPLGEDIGLSVALRDSRGFVWGSAGQRISGHYLPPARWSTNRTVRGMCPTAIPPGTPPGNYTLELNVHLTPGLRELSRVEANGQPVGTRLDLGQITVLPASGDHAPTLTELAVAVPQEARFASPAGGGDLSLLGHSLLPGQLAQGQSFDLSLYWQRDGGADFDVALGLAGDGRGMLLREPLALGYPTSAWAPGERLRGQYRLLLPANLPAGEYELTLSVLPKDGDLPLSVGDGSSLVLGSLIVTELPHLLSAPVVAGKVEAQFGEVASLYGFDLPGLKDGGLTVKTGGRIDLNLVWQSRAATATNYTVFVHLADAEGRPWAQQDAPPGQGERPTTGWLAGEFVSDARQIAVGGDVPPGRYRLLVGMYGPDDHRLPAVLNGERLAGDSVALPGVVVEVNP